MAHNPVLDRVADKMKQALRDQAKASVEALAGKAKQAVAEAVPAPAQPSPSRFAAGPAFRSTIPCSAAAKDRALVILCSSGTFQRQCHEFLTAGLRLDDYDLVAVPGGVQWLALPDILPKHHKVARWMTEYLLRKHSVRRVICIAHQNCSAYEDQSTLGTLAHMVTGKSTFEHQLEQLRHVGNDLTSLFGVGVELYYAAVENGDVVFHSVPTEKGV
ncbi:MAG: hypothetical protein A3K19_00890 [Lentisphaerae bacterium RIFOXYB12_FULL_65_16]|nr:MAG: hypothetical protein A3K18_20240 [Lentisphaerae bacterium RIFOXYA12_64_32]OGV84708.1 MAG: hypothetical protein A3K19_00890 [Lentisphaerae bacterium RIFOXYB12_FULL_65_16]